MLGVRIFLSRAPDLLNGFSDQPEEVDDFLVAFREDFVQGLPWSSITR